MKRIGIDIGSTTIKVVLTDTDNTLLFSAYERHNANVRNVLIKLLNRIKEITSDDEIAVNVTGSVGMGICDALSLPFTQEVICATKYTQTFHKDIRTIIDIGGEDSKIVFLNDTGHYLDMRMNGNCAGGTGAFIDQMSILLGKSINEIDQLAQKSDEVYPIASRCGVFSKTDIQNLISKNVSLENISASIFRAVAVQTITTLSKGDGIKKKILFCGGPLTFIQSLRNAFCNHLNITENDYVVPQEGNIVTAFGAALMAQKSFSLNYLLARLNTPLGIITKSGGLTPLFASTEEYTRWKEKKQIYNIETKKLTSDIKELFIGIDSGSTTTKITAVDSAKRLLFSFYKHHDGDPIGCVRKGLEKLKKSCSDLGINPKIKGSCSTGYGEELIKTAFGLSGGIVETIAHYMGAKEINPKCTFVLDIGGQDMKAIFIENQTLTRIEINEACSSGCGTFIETFAKALNLPIDEFIGEAVTARNPSDLGTRCTVFMNSKVKEALRDGATVGDVAAGLSYSVVKNCLHKVLKLRNTNALGNNIVLDGGTMRNDAIVRAFEKELKLDLYRSNAPELMGAYGCALYALENCSESVTLDDLLSKTDYKIKQIECKGCENSCSVQQYIFHGDKKYYSGNKCENIFNNYPKNFIKGKNLYSTKLNLLFNRKNKTKNGLTIGIPRALNMFENYPFWHTLFDECGIKVVLSDPSIYTKYEKSLRYVMSDNICFPAKLVHYHIDNLAGKGVDRIFMPEVIFEKLEAGAQNSFNCPIVSGYNEVVKSVRQTSIPIDSPVISFKDDKSLEKQCCEYLSGFGLEKSIIIEALSKAKQAQKQYDAEISHEALKYYAEAHEKSQMTFLLAGRPYHADPLIQHKISDIISSMGVNVISTDIVGTIGESNNVKSDFVSQWSYPNRVLEAAEVVASLPDDIQFVMITSFGCGPDAFLTDQVQLILKSANKSLTLLKVDDINNIGSLKLRIRSLIESLKARTNPEKITEPILTTKSFKTEDKGRTIILPFFSEFLSPLIPSIFSLLGYKSVSLPRSSMESAQTGLNYANNEVCYPATLVTGDIINYLNKCGNTDNFAVAITQTGGQCRATNYVSLIKRAMIDAGFSDVPVVCITTNGNGINNYQPGFSIDLKKIIAIVAATVSFSDILSKFYHSAIVRERVKGDSERLRIKYLKSAANYIGKNDSKAIYKLINEAGKEFDSIINPDVVTKKVGIVGEIYLKFNPFANKNVAQWLIDNGIEVIPPSLTDFFMQSFVNITVNTKNRLKKSYFPLWVNKILSILAESKIKLADKAASAYRFYTPSKHIYELSKAGEEIVSLVNQFGEGWLLPAEIVSFAKSGINNVLSLQPFGCIANHIISKGVEKKVKSLYPQLNLLSLDFDSGVSDVNVRNRLQLFKSLIK